MIPTSSTKTVVSSRGRRRPLIATETFVHFEDGDRKIDFILVYLSKEKEKRSIARLEARKLYLERLRHIGLQTEEVTTVNGKQTMHFVKIHAPWEVLAKYAELLEMRLPLNLRESVLYNWSDSVLKYLKIPNFMLQEVPFRPPCCTTSIFQKDKVSKFLWSEDPDIFFNITQRIHIIHEVINSVVYKEEGVIKLGLPHLLHDEIFTDAYPLHDGSYNYRHGDLHFNMRQILFRYWASWRNLFKYQPFDHVRHYFGTKIAFYFAWVGFYISWLVPYSIVCCLFLSYQIYQFFYDSSANEICQSGHKYKMCPLCFNCHYWYISDACWYMRIEAALDNMGTVMFSIFSTLWGLLFCHFWRRNSSVLAFQWATYDRDPVEERPRYEYVRLATEVRINPITDRDEAYFPARKRNLRIILTYSIMIGFTAAVLIAIMALFIYRKTMSEAYKSVALSIGINRPFVAAIMPALVGGGIQVLLVLIMEEFYVYIATVLTTWEMHRTENEYENHLIFKIFLFQFVDYNASFLYIAFFKASLSRGLYPKITGDHLIQNYALPTEHCDVGSCYVEMSIQLIITIIGKQGALIVKEWIKPKIFLILRRVRRKPHPKGTPRWEKDYNLVKYKGIYRQHIRYAMQFSFITVFVVAFPLAPLFALILNIINLRVHAQNLLCLTRRPVPYNSKNIGIMSYIFEALCKLAIMSNAFIMAFTSEMVPRFVYQYENDWEMSGYANFTMSKLEPSVTNLSESCYFRNLFLDADGKASRTSWRIRAIRFIFTVAYEHVAYCIHYIVAAMLPYTPKKVKILTDREHHLAKRALLDVDIEEG